LSFGEEKVLHDSLKEGWLSINESKQSGVWKWTKYWAVLLKHELRLYARKNDEAPVKDFEITNLKLIRSQASSSALGSSFFSCNEDLSFRLCTKSPSQSFVLTSESCGERDSWVSAINAARKGALWDPENIKVDSPHGFSSLPESYNFLAVPSASDVRVIVHKEGYLVKRGFRRKNWKRRWFVLTSWTLRYFVKPGAIHEKGLIHLRDIQVVTASEYKPFCFEIYCPYRVYLIQAPDNATRLAWIEHISRYASS